MKEKKKFMRNGVSVLLILALTVCGVNIDVWQDNVQADINSEVQVIGSLSDKVTGTWSYWDGSKDVVQSNEMLLDKLPTRENKGTYRWTTDNYDATTGPFGIGSWSSSMGWNYTSNEFGNSVYAIPLSYVATKNGVFVTKPSTIAVEDQNTNTIFMNQPEDGSLSDFVVGTGYTFASSKVDKETEWSTDIVMENVSNTNQYMKTIMTQGSPFSFFELKGSATITIQRKRNLPSAVVAYNGTTLNDSTMLVIRVYDNQDLVTGYGDYDYYALYVPQGTTWTQADATASYADNKMGNLSANFPSEDKAYMSLAYLCETSGQNDALANTIALEYQKYAYNFITDTETSFVYNRNNGTITTTYKYSIDKKAESTADGTLMGILPHQYKNMSGYTYLENTTRTIRGTMKYLAGSSYDTVLTYSGILHTMPSIEDADKPQLQSYIDEFMDEYGPTDTELTKEEYSANTYDTGKKLNRALQVMEAAEECGDTETASKLLKAIEKELADWYTSTGEDDDKYFYYDEGTGSLFGFPQAYYTVDGMTDHHFHYGYFIQASAQVALRDPSFIQKYGNIVEELIGDIATYEENTPESRYPFLRYFSTYEGHSWASGHANFADGNNQESSSEAINAWAALILWGQATQNQEMTDLGVYLYQTEISSVNNYWFDVDGDVLDSKFTKIASADSSLPKYAYASMVWSGKYTYAAWWTAEPLQVQGINILPMTSASFYYAKDTDFVLKNWKAVILKEAEYIGDDKDTNRWNELWSAYLAIADPELALDYFDDTCPPEAGDSKAHAYHYIMALDKAGTPNLKITCNNPLATTFADEDGNVTYVAYNAGSVTETVEFSDGTQMVVEPGKMVSSSDSQISGKSNYTVEHYLQNTDGSYELFQKEIKSAKTNSEVTAISKTYEGYNLNDNIEGTLVSGIVTEDGNLILKLYYDIVEISTTVQGQDTSKYTKLGQYDGYDIMYYVMQDDFGIANIQLLDSNRTFYVVYSANYNGSNTTGYLNQIESPHNVLSGVYNLQIPSLAKDSWNTIKIVSGDKQVYIVVKYGNPTGAPDTSDYEGKVEETDPNLPTEISGFVVGCPSDNTIMVIFRESSEQNEKGQLYNIYVDDEVVMSNVDAGTYTLTDISRGRHKVKVTAVLNDVESDGISSLVNVTGEVETTTTQKNVETTTTLKPVETTTVASSLEAETNTTIVDTTTTAEPITQTPTTTVLKTTETKVTTNAVETKKVKVAKTKVKKAVKKKTANKIKISLKKIKDAKKYQIQISKRKNFKKKNILVRKTVKKAKFTIKRKKFKNRNKLYVRARAIKIVNGKKYYGKWSKKKKVKIKK